MPTKVPTGIVVIGLSVDLTGVKGALVIMLILTNVPVSLSRNVDLVIQMIPVTRGGLLGRKGSRGPIRGLVLLVSGELNGVIDVGVCWGTVRKVPVI